ncbi:hypothetical protein RRG08_004331 [Elysia crispata]|uniref:Uncharacterized protein n=1 Tax=Elysia crispata TaxID=231223 RepID=A0AAE1AY96_9GAST|nr:hypothetical protein RRG08_004331 [Elysia crispata]
MLSTEQPNPDNSREKTMLNTTHALRGEHLRRLQDKSITMLLAQWTPAVRSLPFEPRTSRKYEKRLTLRYWMERGFKTQT